MYLKVYVTPGAKRERIEQKEAELYISVREPAKQNLANARVRELVAAFLKVPTGKVRIIAGHHSPSKMLSITTKDLSDT